MNADMFGYQELGVPVFLLVPEFADNISFLVFIFSFIHSFIYLTQALGNVAYRTQHITSSLKTQKTTQLQINRKCWDHLNMQLTH